MKNKIRNILFSAVLIIGLLSAPAGRASAAPSHTYVGQLCTLRANSALHSKYDNSSSLNKPMLYIKVARTFLITQELDAGHGRFVFQLTEEEPGYSAQGWVRSSDCSKIAAP